LNGSSVSLVSTSAPIILNIETVFLPYIPVPCSQPHHRTNIFHLLIFVSLISTDLGFLPALQSIAVGPVDSLCVPAATVTGSFNVEKDLRKSVKPNGLPELCSSQSVVMKSDYSILNNTSSVKEVWYHNKYISNNPVCLSTVQMSEDLEGPRD
jgi:hypothetical protein